MSTRRCAVRRALLEADVNFKVAKDFIAAVRERAVGQDVLKSLTPGQTVISIVNEELMNILGKEREPLNFPDTTQIIMLGRFAGIRQDDPCRPSSRPCCAKKAACRCWRPPKLVYRPAAIKQLQTLGRQIDVTVYGRRERPPTQSTSRKTPSRWRKERGYNTVVWWITAGRLQIDERMMNRRLPRSSASCSQRKCCWSPMP